MDRNFRWEVSKGELKVTQRNRQKNRATGRKVRVRGGREKVCVWLCERQQHFSAHKTIVDTTVKDGVFKLPKCDKIL